MKEKEWKLWEKYATEAEKKVRDEAVKRLEASGESWLTATLLAERGITTSEERDKFFAPKLSHLHDPFLMRDMDKVIPRIEKAISNNERILVYGDYDTDGTTAVALLYSYLHKDYDNIDFYVPDRYTEGYGISRKGMDYAASTGVKLVIALDCGIRANEQIAYANQHGIDVIVGDHHLPGDELPPAFAILDPKRDGCDYPYKELSGCGIAFKIVEAMLEKKLGVKMCDNPDLQTGVGERLKKNLARYLDLAVLSIASDIVPITGENRVLAYFGLRMINYCPRPGIEKILFYSDIVHKKDGLKDQYFNKELTISDLVFLVGPRINAAGRIEDAKDSVKLLLCDNEQNANQWAEKINKYNSERKKLDHAVTEEATHMIDSNPKLQNKKSIVLFDENWHKGVIGIVASRLVEEFYKPTIIFTKSDDLYTGSARSVKEFDIHSAIGQCSDLLEHFGGHKYAAGLAVKPENYVKFVERFEEVVSNSILDEQTIPEIEIDAEVSLAKDIQNDGFLDDLKKFAPFGPGNMLPVFRTNNMVQYKNPTDPKDDKYNPRQVGNAEVKHLKFYPIELDNSQTKIYPAIGFGLGEYYEALKNEKSFDICYHIEENFWNGKTELQLNVKDLKLRPKDE